MKGAWLVIRRGSRTERIGWYSLRAAAERGAATMNAEYDTDRYEVES